MAGESSTGNRLIIQFSTTEDSLDNWASALIRRLTHSPFSHVDLVLPDGSLLGASDQGPTSPCIEGNQRGVAIRPPDYQRFGYRRQMILETDRAGAVIEAARTQLGKPFDNAALHDFLSDKFPDYRDWRDPAAWFCAEFLTWAEEQGGYWANPPLLWPKTRVSPTDHLLLHLTDSRWVNRDTFWNPIPGLKLGSHER